MTHLVTIPLFAGYTAEVPLLHVEGSGGNTAGDGWEVDVDITVRAPDGTALDPASVAYAFTEMLEREIRSGRCIEINAALRELQGAAE